MRKQFYLHKRGRVWYVQYSLPDGGRSTPKSTSQTNRTAAEKWAAEHASIAERRTASSFGEWAEPFFGDRCPHARRLAEEGRVLSPYSQAIRRGYLERLILPDRVLGAVPLAELRRADLLAFRSRLVESRGLCRSTQAVMGLVRIIVREALFQDLIDRDPTPGTATLKYAKKSRLAVPSSVIIKVLNPKLYSSSLWHRAVTTTALTGMRAGEVRALAWGSIADGRIRVWQSFRGATSSLGGTKNGRERSLLIPETLKPILTAPADAKADTWCFSAAKGVPISYRYFATAFTRAAAEAGAPGLTLHGLRHSLNSSLREAGVSDELLRAWFGWSGAGIQENYTHRAIYDLSPVAAAIDDLYKEALQ